MFVVFIVPHKQAKTNLPQDLKFTKKKKIIEKTYGLIPGRLYLRLCTTKFLLFRSVERHLS